MVFFRSLTNALFIVSPALFEDFSNLNSLLCNACASSDVVQLQIYSAFSIANAATAAEVGKSESGLGLTRT